MWDWKKSFFKKASGRKKSRNVRKSVWKPKPTPNLLEVAHASLTEEQHRKISQSSKNTTTLKTSFSLKGQKKPLAQSITLTSSLPDNRLPQQMEEVQSDEVSAHGAQDIPPNQPKSLAALFQNSTADDLANNIVIPTPSDTAAILKTSTEDNQAEDSHKSILPSPLLDEPSYFSSTLWLRWLILLLLVIAPVIGYFTEPWLWQWQRLHQEAPPVPAQNTPLVMLVGSHPTSSQITEDQFFRGVSRLLHSDAKAIGFFRSPYQWLPDPTDPLQYEHLNQLLERFPHVVIGLDAHTQVPDNPTNPVVSFLLPKNLMQLPTDDFSRLRLRHYQVKSEILGKLLPHINVGFLEPVETKQTVPVRQLGTHQALARVRLTSQSILEPSSELQVSPSFATMMVIVSKKLRPAQFRSDHTWLKRTVVSDQTSISVRSDGFYTPTLPFVQPEVVIWEDWLLGKKKVLLSDRSIIIGQLDQQHYLPDPSRPLALDWKLPVGTLKAIPELWWQAHVISNLQTGIGHPTPDFFQQLIVSWLLICLLVGISMFNRYFALPLMVLVLATMVILSWYFPAFSLWNSAGLALLMLPLLILLGKVCYRQPVMHTLVQEDAISDKRGLEQSPEEDAWAKLFDRSSPSEALKEPVENIHAATDSLDQSSMSLFTIETNWSQVHALNLSSAPDQKIFSQSSGQSSENHTIPATAADILKPSTQEIYPFVDDTTSEEKEKEILEQQKRRAQEVVSDIVLPQESSYSRESRIVNTHRFNNLLVDHLQTRTIDSASDVHLGRYQIERVLGKGAMGMVYLGLDPHINRRVAIKTVPLPEEAKQGENEQLTARFFREAQAAGKLTHPGIVTVYDAGLYQNNVYIAMEYLEGHDLSNFIDPAHLLPIPTVVNLIARVAEALHFAHEHGVVHRDIKPANIIFDSAHNVIKVTDFGIAHIHDSNRAMTQVLVGSPNYMSPEHLTGEQLDGRTDLFSLAVTLYVLCCGHTPFSADNVSQLMFSILNDAPRDIQQFRPELPASIIAIITRALQKDRKLRYGSGASMAQDLLISLR